jgi:hypothetical protein
MAPQPPAALSGCPILSIAVNAYQTITAALVKPPPGRLNFYPGLDAKSEQNASQNMLRAFSCVFVLCPQYPKLTLARGNYFYTTAGPHICAVPLQ